MQSEHRSHRKAKKEKQQHQQKLPHSTTKGPFFEEFVSIILQQIPW